MRYADPQRSGRSDVEALSVLRIIQIKAVTVLLDTEADCSESEYGGNNQQLQPIPECFPYLTLFCSFCERSILVVLFRYFIISHKSCSFSSISVFICTVPHL